MIMRDNLLIEAVRRAAHPLTGTREDFTPLLERIGDASVVMLGEATHGTHEFYLARQQITRRLIEEKGFAGVAVEADWPDAYRVNRYVRGRGSDERAIDALADFVRFPQWMWRNADVLDMVGWLHEHNRGRAEREQVGFYGLDLYSLYRSIDAVIHYLDEVDPEAAVRARRRYACFDQGMEDPQQYGYAMAVGVRPDCEAQAVQQLIDLQMHAADYLRRDGVLAADEQFYAEQNAQLVSRAEEYYRAMFHQPALTWNLRDQHMVDTLAALREHLERTRGTGKVVVWAHNSHLGDARATDMGRRGEHNLGQLGRERFGREDVVLVGFTTAVGTVSAASDWDGVVERKGVRPPLDGSIEALFHDIARGSRLENFLLTTDRYDLADPLDESRLQRMIGVTYRPETERASHYFNCRLASQFDAVLHYDESRAVEPLDLSAPWRKGETAETYPSGL